MIPRLVLSSLLLTMLYILLGISNQIEVLDCIVMRDLPEGVFRKAAIVTEIQKKLHHREPMAEAADVRPEKQTVLEFRQKTRGIRMVAIQNHIRVR